MLMINFYLVLEKVLTSIVLIFLLIET